MLHVQTSQYIVILIKDIEELNDTLVFAHPLLVMRSTHGGAFSYEFLHLLVDVLHFRCLLHEGLELEDQKEMVVDVFSGCPVLNLLLLLHIFCCSQIHQNTYYYVLIIMTFSCEIKEWSKLMPITGVKN
jgi:hypothetical protein